ncbi:MAG: trehalose-phosphatase [Candidatus Omnitrophica bacterium]|nr:trehalose-phosphatase [Candidatus Omnitrophota bacterium]
MEYLFSHNTGLRDILNDKFIFLFLDYDGTLAPIADSPASATLSGKNKRLLRSLSKKPDCRLAIISGRSLEDIKVTVGLKDLIYAGNHGLEVEGPGIKFKSRVSPGSKSVIRRLYEEMAGKFSTIKGVFVEDKGLTISVHYRLVAEKDLKCFSSIFLEVTGPYVLSGKIGIDSGKKVYEIKPPVKWDKGKVVLWLLARRQFVSGKKKILSVYAGDDATDEDAFMALKKKGLTISVGNRSGSEARYYLKDAGEVTEFLKLIRDLRERA